MRSSNLLLGSCLLLAPCLLLPSVASAQTLSDALEQEARVLEAERSALEKALSEALAGNEVAKRALTESIESLGAELVRLRAQNAQRETDLPARERIRSAEGQARALDELQQQIDGWLELNGAQRDTGVKGALARVLERGALREGGEHTVFGADGEAESRAVTRLGRVAAISAGRPLVPVGEGYRVVDVPVERRDTPDGVTQTVVLYDPEDPQVAERGGFASWLRAGGPLLWPILALALLGSLVVLERTVRLSLIGISWGRFRDALRLHEGQHDWDAAVRAALEQRPRWLMQPFIDILANRDNPLQKLEERATESLLKVRPQLQRRLSVLGVTAAVAPLLGLLGTVTGMISTFSAITTHGTGDPHLLSDGISEALITTQLGLAVAVPALLLHTGLLRWSSAIFVQIEDSCLGLLHHLEDLELPREDAVHHNHARHQHG